MIKSEIKWYSVDEKLPCFYEKNFPYVIACIDEEIEIRSERKKTRVTKIIKYKWCAGKTKAFCWMDFYGGPIEDQSSVKFWAYIPEFECEEYKHKKINIKTCRKM